MFHAPKGPTSSSAWYGTVPHDPALPPSASAPPAASRQFHGGYRHGSCDCSTPPEASDGHWMDFTERGRGRPRPRGWSVGCPAPPYPSETFTLQFASSRKGLVLTHNHMKGPPGMNVDMASPPFTTHGGLPQARFFTFQT